MTIAEDETTAPRIFYVAYSFDGERWFIHRAGDDPPFEFSERERWHGEQAVGRVMRAAYGTNVQWRWAQKTPS